MTALPIPADVSRHSADVLLTALVEIPSVNPAYDADSPGEVEIARAIGELCGLLGCEIDFPGEIDGRRNVRARLPATDPRFTLLIEGHTDTVSLPAADTHPTARTADGKLYGRGACDVKGGLAAALLAMSELAVHRPRHVDVALLGAIDEEHHFRGITEFLARGELPDAAIVLEPTELAIVNEHNGVLRVEILVSGQAGHTSLPPTGRNAIIDAAVVMDSLRKWHERWTAAERAAGGLLTVTKVNGGRAINIVPDACRFSIDIRVAPRDDPDAMLHALRDELARLASDGVSASVETVLLLDGGMSTDKDTLLVRSALAAARQRDPVWVSYGTDGSKIARVGVPTIVFGPGSIAQAHGDDEWIRIDDVIRAAEVLIGTIRAIDEQVAM